MHSHDTHDANAGSPCALPDLGEFTLDDLNGLGPQAVAPYAQKIRAAVKQPRANLGQSGPPGRAD